MVYEVANNDVIKTSYHDTRLDPIVQQFYSWAHYFIPEHISRAFRVIFLANEVVRATRTTTLVAWLRL